MIKKVLQALADENFGDKHYPVPLEADSTDVKPLVLAVKRKRNIWKRPFNKSEFGIIAGLEYYVTEDKKNEFLNGINNKMQRRSDLQIKNKKDDEPAESYMEVGLKAADIVEGNLKISYELGELELGKLDQEYFKDPVLEDILKESELDAEKMKRFENEKLHLIYSVIYSERFQLTGKRQSEVVVDAGAHIPISIIPQLKAKAKAHFKKNTVPPKAVTRTTRGPVYYKSVPVVYDKAQAKLKLKPGEFAGIRSFADKFDEVHTEKSEITLAFEDEDSDLAASLTDEDFKKLDIIKKAVLLKSENRDKRKERVKKYLTWFEEALTTDKKTLSLPHDKPLTDEDCDFLQNIFCQALPGRKHIVDLSALKSADKIQGYAIVLKLIDDLSDEEWEEIEKAWAEPEQDE